MHGIDRMEQDREINMNNNNFRGMRNRFIERDFFEQSTRDIDYNNPAAASNKPTSRIGEITGQELSTSDLECGMPLRSAYYGKRIQRNDVAKTRSDFDLFDDRGQQDFNIAYNDPINPISPTYSTILAGSEKVIPELYGTDPGSFITANINKFNINLFSLLKGQLNDKFCVSPYGLFNIFGAIYFASTGVSESDIYDYYSMVSKDNVLEGLDFIRKLYDKPAQYKQVILKHMIFINSDLPANATFIKYISPIVEVFPISPKYPGKEAKNINDYISKLSSGMVHPISEKIIAKAQIICANIGLIKPIWKQPFDKTFDGKFVGTKTKVVRMLGQVDSQYEYFEDNLNQVIELRCAGDVMSMGIILPKQLVIPEINYEEFNALIRNLKVTYIDEIRVPAFSQQIKMKLTNLLYQNGLRSVFYKLYSPELVKAETSISDVVQNLTVVIANSPNIENKTSKANHIRSTISNIKFIADHPFIYYFRLLSTSTILLMGYYC
jgi:serine protease inhibitor